jgi:hypothetical protein
LDLSELKPCVVLFGYGFGLVNSVVLSVIFFHAYFNGFRAVVTVNSVGEAHLEAVLMPVCLVVSVVGFVLYFKSLKRK